MARIFEVNTTKPLSTQSPSGDYCFIFDDTAVKASRFAASLIIMSASLLGNTLVLAVSCLNKLTIDPKTTTNRLISNMAVADLIITLTYMPRTMVLVIRGYEWLVGGTAGLVLCKLVPSLYHMAIIVCILTLVALSIERFSVVAWPSTVPFTTRHVRAVIGGIWLVAFLARLPRLIVLKTMKDKNGLLKCMFTKPMNDLYGSPNATQTYDLFLKSTFYLLPLALIVIFHSGTIIKLRRRARPQGAVSSTTGNRSREEMNKNVFKMVLSVTTAFAVCWVAYFVAKESVVQISVDCNVTYVRILLAHSNSVITPCLYAIFSTKYRRGFKLILKYIFCRLTPRDARRNSDIALRIVDNDERHEEANQVTFKRDPRFSRGKHRAKRERTESTRSTVRLIRD